MKWTFSLKLNLTAFLQQQKIHTNKKIYTKFATSKGGQKSILDKKFT